MKVLVLAILLFNSLAFSAEDLALTKDEVLSRIDAGTLTFEKSSILPSSDQKNGKTTIIPQDMTIQHIMKKNPMLKEEYLYYNYRRTNKWEYTINYEWWDRQCKLRILGYTKEKGMMVYQNNKETIEGIKIPTKYCEKVYQMKIN